MRSLLSPLTLVLARGRRRPGRWLPAVLGLALATAFACAVAGEATIAADQAARTALRGAPALGRTIVLSAQGPDSPSLERRVRGLLAGLGERHPTRVTLLGGVRLSGVVVRLAAISPVQDWVSGALSRQLGRCRARACPVLLLNGEIGRQALAANGVHLAVRGRAVLRSPQPLGFAPGAGGGPPVVLSADPAGVDRLAGLSSVYRTQSWLAIPALAALHSWQLGGYEARLQRTQAGLAADGQLAMSAPFSALDQARTTARDAPRRLLLAGGGALAALTGFLVLAAYALRHERRDDVRRLQAAGARTGQRVAFAVGEGAALAGLGLLLGAALGILACAALAGHAQLPIGQVLAHGLPAPLAAPLLVGGWLLATVLVTLVLLAPSARAADLLAVAALAALALTLTRGAAATGPLPVLLAPLACACAGVLIYRLAYGVLRFGGTGGHRFIGDGPAVLRLALLGLARAPAAPALAIAFLAVSTGLGGFALGYRATLIRGAADAAADRVPLDAVIGPSAAFATPLQLASLPRWRTLAGGAVFPVRRTYASYLSASAAVTVPALGVPATALSSIHGWRAADGSAPLAVLARRLVPAGPIRTPGPELPAGGELSISAMTNEGAALISAKLRTPAGIVRDLMLGSATPKRATLRARLPSGHFELEALSLAAPTGLTATNGHQNAENPAAATQAASVVSLGPPRVTGAAGQALGIGRWLGVGAATRAVATRPGGLRVRFTETGAPGVLRPPQPSDERAVPVLADAGTAAAAAGARLALSVDGLPVVGRVVGTVRRLPTLPAGSAGFVLADEATLAAALDASLPGQGRPDELWIATRHPRRLRAALARAPLDPLTASFRASVEQTLGADPVARAVLGTLAAAAGVGLGLALLGLLVALLGTLRDVRAERELAALGLGPRALRRELQARILTTAGLGLLAGVALAAALTRLAVAAVRATVTLDLGGPSLVAVTPWATLGLGALATLVAMAVCAWIVSWTNAGAP